MRTLLFIALALAAPLASASDTESTVASVSHEQDALVVTDVRLQPTELAGIIAVKGSVLNQGDKSLEVASVDFDLLDKDGHVVGEAVVTGRSIGAGLKWGFSTTAVADGATSVKIRKITAS
jgi:hypothetical protein